MNRGELVQQLTARGIETTDAHSDERLSELLSAVVAAEEAERAAEADGAGEEELAAYEAAVERVKQVMEAAAADLGGTPADAGALPNFDPATARHADGTGEAMTPAQGDTVSSEPPAAPKEPEAPAKGRGGRRSRPETDPNELVSCVLGPRSPAGRLLVGNAAIEAKKPGRIPRGEFERLQAEYDLVEVEG